MTNPPTIGTTPSRRTRRHGRPGAALLVAGALALLAGACSDDESATTTTVDSEQAFCDALSSCRPTSRHLRTSMWSTAASTR